MKQVRYVNPDGTCPAQGLYSHVTEVPSGSLLFIAGQLSVNANGSVVGKNDFDSQFKQVFANLGDVLKGMGTGFESIIKFTTYLVHSQDIEKFMQLREDHFPKMFSGKLFPPNTLLVVDRLVNEDFLFEVEAVALAPQS
jgi:enamine deaminase RidA (YjgF/YER057c/UK114 family)